MASANLRQELDCSICRSNYTDPVTLTCGHNYCRECINSALDTQDGSGVYTCPVCRTIFNERPAPQINTTLNTLVDIFTQPDQEETGIFCTYCVDSPVPAAKCCLMCEASLCDKHLRVHSKSPEHVLCDPTTSLGNRKCPIHACICVSCTMVGEHRGHHKESLEEASEKKKLKLRNFLQKLVTAREETEEKDQSLQEQGRQFQQKTADIIERVTALFRDIRRQLEDLEKRVLSDISRQEEHFSFSVCDLMQQMEIKKDELSWKMHHIEELCNMSDPVTVLQEPDTGALCDTEDREGHYTQFHDVGDLDVGLISGTLRTLSNIIKDINIGIYMQEATDILLDVITAGNYIEISGDRKTATTSDITLDHPDALERFENCQVISTRGFSSGRHYWEVEIRESLWWSVGMSYPSIDRRGDQSDIGDNDKSWALSRINCDYSVIHNKTWISVANNIPCDRVRICLDYEAGQLSFYSLCDPIRHLHTFTATFTEPLHAALCVREGCMKLFGESGPGLLNSLYNLRIVE